MTNPKPNQQHQSAVVKAEEISKFLDRTGFVFEMRVNELLLDSDYATIISSDFFDLDEQKTREIDIIAWKKINEIHCHLIIECKQSATTSGSSSPTSACLSSLQR